jgi:hypothetical protein
MGWCGVEVLEKKMVASWACLVYSLVRRSQGEVVVSRFLRRRRL